MAKSGVERAMAGVGTAPHGQQLNSTYSWYALFTLDLGSEVLGVRLGHLVARHVEAVAVVLFLLGFAD